MSGSEARKAPQIKFVRKRPLIGESSGARVGAAFDYGVGAIEVTLEIGWTQHSDEQLIRIGEEYLRRERLRGPLKNEKPYTLTASGVEALELFMKGSGEAR